MNTEATTLYKLMILYMLSKVNFPLSNSQISEFMLDRQYTTYFTLQEVLNALAEDGFINVLSYRNSTQYRLTHEGTDTISFFSNKISNTIREEIDTYLKENKYDLRSEAGTLCDYYKSTSGDYIVHCLVKEGETNLIELNLSVPLEEQADAMCSKWKGSSQDIYDFIMHKLM
jgi:DNA-binding HxlR family transcriptional regulator